MLTNEQREDQKTKATSGHKASEAHETNVIKTTEKNIQNSIPKINTTFNGNFSGNSVQGKTLSIVKGKGNLKHNLREFIAPNVDAARTEENVILDKETVETVYTETFSQAIDEYNATQTKPSRKKSIKKYMDEIKKNEKLPGKTQLYYEQVVQVGTMEDTGNLTNPEEAATAKKILIEYYKGFKERNKNIRCFSAVVHMDESTPHLHMDYLPISREGYKQGLKVRNSLNRALVEQGIPQGQNNSKDNAFLNWIEIERNELKKIAEKYNVKVKELHSKKREKLSPEEYRELGRQAKKEVQAELNEKDKKLAELEKSNEILRAKLQEQKQSPVAHQDEPVPGKKQKPVENPEPKKEQPKQPEPVKPIEKPENQQKTEEPEKNEAVIRPVEPLKKADTISDTPIKQEQPKVEDKQSEPHKTEQKPETVPGLSPEQRQLLEIELANLEEEKSKLLERQKIIDDNLFRGNEAQLKTEYKLQEVQAQKESAYFWQRKNIEKEINKLSAYQLKVQKEIDRMENLNEDNHSQTQKIDAAIEKIDRQLNPAKYLEKDKQKAIQAEKTKNVTKFIDNTKARPAKDLAKKIKSKVKTKTKGLSL